MKPARSAYKIYELRRHLTPRDLDVVRSLETYRLLTTGQIQRLHFTEHVSSSSAARTAVRVLGRIEGHGLIVRLRRRIGGLDKGSAANVWQLAALGERLLRALDGDPNRRRFIEPSEPFTEHTVAVAELAVRIIEESRHGSFEALTLETEPECWRSWVGAAGTEQWIKADLFVVTASADYEAHAFVEIDRDTEHMPAIIRKCLTYQRYSNTGIEQARAELFPAVVWVVPGEHRAERIRAAILGELSLTAALFHVVTTDEALDVLRPEPTAPNGATEPPSTQPKGGTL